MQILSIYTVCKMLCAIKLSIKLETFAYSICNNRRYLLIKISRAGVPTIRLYVAKEKKNQ